MISKIKAVIFWSVITAAFIGPGTVTTAATAGSFYGIQLLWALTFSVVACIVLQEAAARLTIISKKTLAENLADAFDNKTIPYLVAGSIVFGCAAYQAGNLAGAGIGLGLLLDIHRHWIILCIVAAGSIVLWFGTINTIARLMGIIVAVMGFAFVYVAAQTTFSTLESMKALFIPQFPSGSGVLIIGLIGTTIVPYNIFLGSSLRHRTNIPGMRAGLIPSILLGGIISMAIIFSGTLVQEPFEFKRLSEALRQEQGTWASTMLGIGLFAAGFTSSLTAPLAAAITFQTGTHGKEKRRDQNSKTYRIIWILVMVIGSFFALTDIRPVPLIILAQGVNGIILPMVGIMLFILINRRYIEVRGVRNPWMNNIALLLVVILCIVLGAYGIYSVVQTVF